MSSDIEWTDETWNPTLGCSKVSPGCDGCYAINVAHRGLTPAHQGLTIKRPGERPDWTGEVRSMPDRLDTPLRWRKPRRVFVDSMSDLFHAAVPDAFVVEVLATMQLTPRHTYQVLTKRPQRMRAFFADMWDGAPKLREQATCDEDLAAIDRLFNPLPNVWLGTSIESDRYAWRADHLRATPAAVRFLSLEPLLGPLPSLDLTGIDWVIVGGESGPGARPMHPAWVRDIRDRCVEAGVAFFFKQWGAWSPTSPEDWSEDAGGVTCVKLDGSTSWCAGSDDLGACTNWSTNYEPADQQVQRVGKKVAGRQLDGWTFDEMPG